MVRLVFLGSSVPLHLYAVILIPNCVLCIVTMLPPSVAKIARRSPALTRAASTATAQKAVKKEGDISDAFVSLSGARRPPLPDRFRKLKCDLVRGRERQIADSWTRLLRRLRAENEIIAQKGSDVIPQVNFADLDAGCEGLKEEIRKRGAIVVRGVIPEGEARAYKEGIEDYVKKNPWTRGEHIHRSLF